MATIKSHTDLPQSKMLAEFLSLESADTIWDLTIPDLPTIRAIPYEDSDYNNKYLNIKPCWSLAALLNVLPNNEHIDTTISRGSWKIEPVEYLPNIWWCEYEDTKNQTEFNISADNPVDACYEMIIKLHEQKLL